MVLPYFVLPAARLLIYIKNRLDNEVVREVTLEYTAGPIVMGGGTSTSSPPCSPIMIYFIRNRFLKQMKFKIRRADNSMRMFGKESEIGGTDQTCYFPYPQVAVSNTTMRP
jgi:hypothetical protein